jgi:hypothetical protein
VHGEEPQLQAMQNAVHSQNISEAIIPSHLEDFEL